MNYVVLENVRSAYNVGNIIRTADALGWGVILSGYTPDEKNNKVKKTSLGAENNVNIIKIQDSIFDTTKTINWLKNKGYFIISAEITNKSVDLKTFTKNKTDFIDKNKNIAVILGNEVSGIIEKTLKLSDIILHINMKGIKSSLNVGQAGAIFMRELGNL